MINRSLRQQLRYAPPLPSGYPWFRAGRTPLLHSVPQQVGGTICKRFAKFRFFALEASFFSTLLAVFSSYIVHRTNSPLRKVMDVCAQIPSAIPGSLLGMSISIASAKLDFRNSPVLIVIAMTIAFLPFSYCEISQSYGQIRMTLDEGSHSLGANQIVTLGKVILPLSIDGVFSGFIYTFIRSVGTLSAVIFLVSFKTPLTSISIVNLAEQGDWGKSASLAMVLTLITFFVLGIGKLILNRIKR